jgi:hypothetical protein
MDTNTEPQTGDKLKVWNESAEAPTLKTGGQTPRKLGKGRTTNTSKLSNASSTAARNYQLKL